MKKLVLVLAILMVASVGFAQTSAFSLSLSPISLPGNHQTVAGTEAGAALTVTKNLDLKSENILAPGQNFQYFGGGFNYRLPILSTKLDNASPTLPGARFRFYLTGSVGADRITSAADVRQHWGFTGGGGVEYDLTGSGRFSLGAEIQYAKFPGFNNNTFTVSLDPKIHF